MVQVSKICVNHSLQGFQKAELVRVASSEVVHFQHNSDILQLTGLSVPVTQKVFLHYMKVPWSISWNGHKRAVKF